MKHETRNLGSIGYEQEDVFTFPQGILGFPDCKKYLVFEDGRTSPVQWLIGLDKDGPELPLINPSLLGEYQLATKNIRPGILRALDLRSIVGMRTLCVLTVPNQIRKASLDLRAPILIHPRRRVGFQHLWPEDSRQPVRKQVYGDLVPGDPADKGGMVIAHRKVGETIEIGEDVTVQVLELADGGVRLGVYAPRRVPVNRGRHPVTAKQENIRASEVLNIGNLKSLMGMFSTHDVRTTEVVRPRRPGELVEAGTEAEQSERNAGEERPRGPANARFRGIDASKATASA